MVTKGNRTFVGSLTCVDHFGNVLLFDAVEDVALEGEHFERVMNQVIVRLDDIASATVLVRLPIRCPRRNLSLPFRQVTSSLCRGVTVEGCALQ